MTYALDPSESASDPVQAMLDGQPLGEGRLFGTAVVIEPGESATWWTALAAHDGGEGAPTDGREIVESAFSSVDAA